MRDHRARTWWLRAGIVAAVAAVGLAVLGVPHHDTPTDHGSLSATTRRAGPPGTTFKLATFNVLGAAHTDTGQRPGWANSAQRMAWAVKLINSNQLQVIGFQEFEAKQYDRFKQLTGSEFGVYPGVRLGRRASVQASIAWRRDTWRLVEARTMRVPYFHGAMVQMPYVKLRNLTTGDEVWFYNSHNPADTHGKAGKWRSQGYQLEADLVARLHASDPSTPIVVTGDKNARAPYFCYMAQHSILHAADGGSWRHRTCDQPSGRLAIDWLMGTSDVRFDSYDAFRNSLVSKTTDHPIVMATTTIAPHAPPKVRHVVVVSVDGLTARGVIREGASGVPALTAMAAKGTSTLNARTEFERTGQAANVVGMLTGRRVNPRRDGHGVGWRTTAPPTVREAAGHYVASAFDLVHDYGYSTALLTHGSGLGIVSRSWGVGAGAPDPYGIDNGRTKISDSVSYASDSAVVRGLVGRLAASPPTFTFAHLQRPASVGLRYGFHSSQYDASVRRISALVGRVQRAIAQKPSLAHHTLLVVTADAGGFGKQDVDPTEIGDYRIPFFATGPSVPAGSDLYALNPQLRKPGADRVGYQGPQPVRNGFVANLVTSALGLPRVPGSTLDSDQSFTVFGPSP